MCGGKIQGRGIKSEIFQERLDVFGEKYVKIPKESKFCQFLLAYHSKT